MVYPGVRGGGGMRARIKEVSAAAGGYRVLVHARRARKERQFTPG